jgi:hypothetical protein
VAAGDFVGHDAQASGTSRRKKSGGKKRSSVQSTNLVGTSGHAANGHGAAVAAVDG